MSGMSMGAISRTRKCSVDVPKNMKYMMMRADMAGLLCVRGGFYRGPLRTTAALTAPMRGLCGAVYRGPLRVRTAAALTAPRR